MIPLAPFGRFCLPLLLFPLLGFSGPSSVQAQSPPLQERDLDREYRRLLAQGAEGTSLGVVGLRLLRLEDLCYEEGWEKTLGAVQKDVAARLEESCGPDCLVPVLYIHRNLILEYLDRVPASAEVLPRPARHALSVLEWMERLHLEEDPRPEGFRIRADFSAAFGEAYRNRGMIENARARFHQALEAIPNHREALYLLGSMEEKLGDYAAAKGPLAVLVSGASPEPVAHLRLALIHARLGRLEEAEGALANLRDPGDGARPPEWVQRLAFQEAAKLRDRQGDRAGAFGLAQQGSEIYPEDQPLRILEAFYTGDRTASRGMLEEAGADRAFLGVESARGRYNNWPSEVVKPLGQRVQATLDATLPQLAKGLVQIRGPGRLP